MSIIGTRPPLISETNLYELHHRAKRSRDIFAAVAILSRIVCGIRRLFATSDTTSFCMLAAIAAGLTASITSCWLRRISDNTSAIICVLFVTGEIAFNLATFSTAAGTADIPRR